MKASELRIGNFIADNLEVVGLPAFSPFIVVRDTTGTVQELRIDSVMPIPLTEEWLLKFGATLKDIEGFEEHTDEVYTDYYFVIGNNGRILTVSCTPDGLFDFIVSDKYGNEFFLGTYKYVHQLQNLYFDLTGEDLTLK